MSISKNIAQILKCASLAPSSHNTQPWKVKIISESELIIQSDSTRWLPKVDPDNRELLLSIGAFWENLIQAALAFGFEAQTEVQATNPKDTDILKVRLVRCPPLKDNSLELMKMRVTNRKSYENRDLDTLHLKELKKLLPNNLTYFPRKSKEGEWIANSLIDASKKQAFDDEKQKELAEWLRFSRSEVKKKKGRSYTRDARNVRYSKVFLVYIYEQKECTL
jgi:hypothetical protein